MRGFMGSHSKTPRAIFVFLFFSGDTMYILIKTTTTLPVWLLAQRTSLCTLEKGAPSFYSVTKLYEYIIVTIGCSTATCEKINITSMQLKAVCKNGTHIGLKPTTLWSFLNLMLRRVKHITSLNRQFTDWPGALFRESRDGRRQYLVKYSPCCHEMRWGWQVHFFFSLENCVAHNSKYCSPEYRGIISQFSKIWAINDYF